MAKKKQMQKAKKQRKPRTNGPGPRIFLDGAAVDHVKLMADPCLGKLVYPAFPTAQNGAIMRFRTVIPLGAQAGETSGVFHWTPGQNEYYANGAATSATTLTPSAFSVFPLLQTGGTNVTGTTFRCIAACVKVLFNGSENNRGGIIYAGNTQSASYGAHAGGTTQMGVVAQMLPFTTRIPSSSMEILWVPNEADLSYTIDDAAAGGGVNQGATLGGSITLAVTGMPAAVGLTLEITGVYEVVFGATSALVSSVGAPASSTPWPQVMKGFFNYVGGSTVVIDGLKKAMDYAGIAGPQAMGARAARMALEYL